MKDLENFYVRLGSRIRQVREEKEVTQETLARRVNLSRTSITNLEKGRQKLLLHTFLKIASALRVNPEILLAQVWQEDLEQRVEEEIKKYAPDTQEWIKSIVSPKRKEKV